MTTLLSIETLMAQGESDTLEFKTSTSSLKKGFATLCAFLNNQGGTLLIGVDNTGTPIGQEVSDATQQKIAQHLAKLEPHADINIDYITLQANKPIIKITVHSGQHKPYTYDGRAYQRHQSTTTRMSQHHYEQLLIERGQLHFSWEDSCDRNHGLADLDQEEIYRTLTIGDKMQRIPASALKEDMPEILTRLGLMKEGQLTHGAMVLFGKQHAVYPHCELRLARFKGNQNTGDFLDNRHVTGNAFTLLEEADAFLARHLPVAGRFNKDQYQRIDKPALPVLAIREALVNAIIHRDYQHTGTAIHLAIFDDRLEIWNYGRLPEDLSVAALRTKHHSVLRNKHIAHIFYLRDLVETWGTGTNKMIRLCQQDDLPEPKFSQDTGGLTVTFYFETPVHTAQETQQVMLSDRAHTILSLIKAQHSPINIQDILAQLDNPPSLRTIQADLTLLQKAKVIEQIGKGRATHWKAL